MVTSIASKFQTSKYIAMIDIQRLLSDVYPVIVLVIKSASPYFTLTHFARLCRVSLLTRVGLGSGMSADHHLDTCVW